MSAIEEKALRGLDTVRIGKGELLEIVQGNRDEHRKIFEEALEGWKRKVTQELERAYEDAKAGRDWRGHVVITRPEDHTAEYDHVIRLLELSLDDELELSARDFSQYVMDRWGWQGAFLATANQYGSTTSNMRTFGKGQFTAPDASPPLWQSGDND